MTINYIEILRGFLAIGGVMLFMTLFSLALIAGEVKH